MTSRHEGLPVTGYRPQSSDAVDLVNRNKQLEERILRVLDDLKTLPDVDQRWLATGRTDIEKSFMAVNRAIFRPQRATLPSDLPGG